MDKQTYNTRKTLTKVFYTVSNTRLVHAVSLIMILLIKAFTSGLSSDIMTRDGAVVRGISPRRRGQYNICRSSMIIADDEAYDDEIGWGTGHLGHRGLTYL